MDTLHRGFAELTFDDEHLEVEEVLSAGVVVRPFRGSPRMDPQ